MKQNIGIDNKVECWGIFEIILDGPSHGNPFSDVNFKGKFFKGDIIKEVDGFYDGDGVYIIRFMPDVIGEWEFITESNAVGLDGIRGSFLCKEAEKNNHGPVKVHNQYHFAYSDGTSFFPFGTTCYAWTHQSEKLQEETLATLKENCFNKLRMCVFPKYYSNNNTEPELYPFEGTAPDQWDFTRFQPKFFRHLEKQLLALMELGIESDLILFHPYDKGHWGFDRMDAETDARYLKYLIARLGAFRNIWWSMANEYDYMEKKTKEDWNRNIEIVAKTDPYHHLLSIHQADVLFEHWNPYITHASIQMGLLKGSVRSGMGRLRMLRDAYQKPVIYDEVGYEGNLVQRWGQLEAEALVDNFWQAITSGTYMTHGETFTHPQDIIWWAKGGKLRGKSPKRIAFLKQILEESKLSGLEPLDHWWVINGVGKNGSYYLYYFGNETPTEWKFELPAFKIPVEMGTKFKVEVIDTWNMTICEVEDLFEITDKDRYHYTCNFNPKVELPGREYIAIRIIKVEE
jgi:hypothetical protein